MSGTSKLVSANCSGRAPVGRGRAIAANESGGAPAASSRFATSRGGQYEPETPELVISDVSFTITRTAITMNYTVNAESTCRISYAKAEDIEEMLIEFSLFSPNHETHSHQITGLEEGTVYWLRAWAWDSSGHNAYAPTISQWYSVRTATAVDPGAYIGIEG